MLDHAELETQVRSRLAPLEPLRRRAVRVYWMRGLLALSTLAAAAALAAAASGAAAFLVLQAPRGAEPGGVAQLLPLLLVLALPPALIAPAAAMLVAAMLRGFGRATMLEHERRFRSEVAAPLLRSLLPDARLTPEGRVAEAALRASRLFEGEQRADTSGGLLVEGCAGGVSFAVSTLRAPAPLRRLLRGQRSFSGLFGHIDLPGRFDDATLLSEASAGRRAEWPRPSAELRPVAPDDPELGARFELFALRSQTPRLPPALRTQLLALAGRAAAPLRVSLHGGGMAIAIPLPRPLLPQRLRPNDPMELAREAAFYALVPEIARALAARPDETRRS